MKKILIFGKLGQVGSALVERLSVLPERYRVVALDKDELDLSLTEEIKQAVLDADPDWVINTAAYTAVDAAEADAEVAHLINAAAPRAMAEACKELNVPMIHYSTDYVFDGDGPQGSLRPYVEDDQTNPQSVYGRTKLAGEQAVMSAQADSIILRTAWVYADQGKNFVNTMLRLGNGRDVLNVVSDQYGSPTLADDLAAITIEIIEATPPEKVNKVAGVYHATNRGSTNWSGFAEAIFQYAGLDQVTIKSISSSEYPTPAPRPMYSVLSNQKLYDTFGLKLPDWQDALKRTLG